MSKKIIVLTLLAMLFVTNCASPEITFTPPPIESDWSVTMTQSGGFAGVMKHIKISSDGEYTVTDERSKQTVTNQLTKEQIATLQSLIENFQLTSTQPTSVCADCFVYEIEIESNDKKMIVTVDDMSLPDSGVEELVMFLSGLMQ